MKVTQLDQIELFKQLPERRRRMLLDQSRCLQVDKGVMFFQQGTPVKHVWVVLEGWVHLVRSPEIHNGAHSVVIFTVTPNEALCGVSALEVGTYSASGLAGSHSKVMQIPGSLFRDLLINEPKFAYRVLQLYARRIRHMAEQYGTMADPVLNRIIRTILRLQQQFGQSIPITHRELAQMSWTTTESAIRIVRKLKKQGLVTGSRGKLNVKLTNSLEELLAQRNRHMSL